MDGVGEHPWIIGKNRGRSVSLMRVGVDHHDPDPRLTHLKVANGDGNVIEDAVTLAVLAKSVVGAAREADRHPLGQGGVAGLTGRFDLGGTALIELGGDRETQFQLFLGIELAAVDPGEIVRVVNGLE